MRAWRKDLSDSDGSRSPSPKRNRRSRSPSQDSEGDEKKSTKPRPPVKKDLPIDSVKEDIIKLVKENQLCIITGDTGSGKSTQLAKILYENGLSEKTNGIVVTQPRRIGAVSLAVRVAEEMECDVGDLVGYTIRFEDNTSEHTKIRYVTDGILLREVMEHKDLEPYSVVILDEAHERSLQTDVLFGLLREMAKRRKDLKVLITSATLDTAKFKAFFDCPTFHIPGRCFPVEVEYAEKTKRGYMKAAVEKAKEIHIKEPMGHVLVFLTGQDEIETACKLLGERLDSLHEDGVDMPDVVILPMYANLPSGLQQRIFHEAPEGIRKIVICTNICETSLTVDGVAYVVDPGFVKQKNYDPTTGIDSLTVVPISKVAAEQRKGRAGRTRSGKCFRLYTEKVYTEELPDETAPEIQRTGLSGSVLMMKTLGLDPINFGYLDPPQLESIITALRDLFWLDAIDSKGRIKELGKLMNRFPLDPRISKVLVLSMYYRCVPEILTIAAMVTLDNLWVLPADDEERHRAEEKRMRYFSKFGDHISYLCLFETWQKRGFTKRFCQENYVHFRAMRQAKEVRKQLEEILGRNKNKIKKFLRHHEDSTDLLERTRDIVQDVLQIIAQCYFMNTARRQGIGGEGSNSNSSGGGAMYSPMADETIMLRMHPGSALFQIVPKWIVYAQSTFTSKAFISVASAIQYSWVKKLLPKLHNCNDEMLAGCSLAALQKKTNGGQKSKAPKTELQRKKELAEKAKDRYKRRTQDSAVSDAKARYLARKRARLAGEL